MWIITRSINQYNQDGDYFFCAFDNKPSIEELTKLFSSKTFAEHVQNGGGRIGNEEEWYFLTEMKPGEEYTRK